MSGEASRFSPEPGQSGPFQTQHAPAPPVLQATLGRPSTWCLRLYPLWSYTAHPLICPATPSHGLHLRTSQLPTSRTRCAGSWLQRWWTSSSCYVCFLVMNMLARIQEGSGEWGRVKSCWRPRHGCEGEPRVQAAETLPSLSPITKSHDKILWYNLSNTRPVSTGTSPARERVRDMIGYGT